jgi:ATP-dependent Clp protease adaptor protein ClpS
MSDVATKPRTRIRPQTERPRLHKVILVNDDYTPREFVVTVLKAEEAGRSKGYPLMFTTEPEE